MVSNLLKRGATALSSKQTNILSAALIIMAAIFFSAVLGFIKMRLLSTYFGDSRPLDIYLAAFRLPDMIYQLLVMGTISSAFIPVFSSFLNQENQQSAFKIANSVMTLSMIVFLAVTFFILLFTRQISDFLAPGFSDKEIPLMVSLTRIMMLGQIFFILGNFLTGILQSFHRFLLPALAPVFYNIGIIAGTIILTPFFGIYGPTYGVLIGTFLFFIIQLPFALKIGWRLQISFDYKNKGVKEIGRLLVPRTLSLGVSQIEYTTDLMIASLFAPGHYTVFTFALFLISFPVRLIGASIGQASLPTLSAIFAKDNLSEFKNTLNKSLQQIIYLILPASIILLVLRVPLVRLAFGSKSFSWEATLLTGRVVAFLTVAIVAQSIAQLLIRGFYALHNTKTPFLIGVISVFINVLGSIYFSLILKMGIAGLAISTSISSLINAFLLSKSLIDKLGKIEEEAIISLGKKFFTTGIMGFVLYLFMKILDLFVFDTTRTVNLIFLTIITLALGSTSYLLISRLLRIEEADNYWQILKRMGNWKIELKKRGEVLETAPSETTS